MPQSGEGVVCCAHDGSFGLAVQSTDGGLLLVCGVLGVVAQGGADVASVYPIAMCDGHRYHYRNAWLPHTRYVTLVKWAWWIIRCNFYNVVPAE